MRGRRAAALVLAAALGAGLLAPGPAAAGTYRDEEYGIAIDPGEAWDVTTSPKEPVGGKLGRAAVRLVRGDCTAWLVVFGNAPVDPAENPREAARTAAYLIAGRYEEKGERLLPGIARAETFGASRGVLVEFEVAPAKGDGATRVGRAALAAAGGRLHLALAEAPAASVKPADLAEMERLVLSFRVGEPAAGRRGEAPPPAPVVPAGSGDALPSPEFRSAVDTVRIWTGPSGLEVHRQYYLFEGGKLPSYVCHLLGKDYEFAGRKGKTPELLLLILNNSKGKDAATVRVSLDLPDFSQPAARTVTVAAGQTSFVSLSPVFSDAIYDLQEQRPAALRLRITDPGQKTLLGREKVLYEGTDRVTLLGRNDFFWRDAHGRSWAPCILAFVTPHDRERRVDALLKQAAERSSFKAMVGYQDVGGLSRAETVRRQVAAIYDALAAPGYSYVNAPVSMDARAQRIKYPGEVLKDRSGNCIESVLVFAAALEATGMRPVIILLKNHALVGVRAWEDDPAILALETTLCGRSPAEEAFAAGAKRVQEASRSDSPPDFLDVREYRKMGFAPVPR